MLKSKSILEITKNEKIYQLMLSPESTLGEVFDVLCEMRGYVLNKMIEAEKAEQGKQANDS